MNNVECKARSQGGPIGRCHQAGTTRLGQGHAEVPIPELARADTRTLRGSHKAVSKEKALCVVVFFKLELSMTESYILYIQYT